MTIELRIYAPITGKLIDVRHFDHVEAAYNNMIETHLPALALVEGTRCGGYDYRPHQQGHTLELFARRMQECER